MAVGRASDSDVFIDDMTVSRRHLQLTNLQEGLLIEDIRSSGRMFFNGSLFSSPVLMSLGDRLLFAGYELVLKDIVPAASGDEHKGEDSSLN